MREQIETSRKHLRAGAKPVLAALPILLLLALLALSQVNCALVHATLRPTFSEYACQATLVNSSTGERRVVRSSMLDATAPGAPARIFYDYDWDGNGVRNDADVRFDWRRYLGHDVLNSATFIGRSWCVRPSDVTCVRTGRLVVNTMSAPMPGGILGDCPGSIPVLRLLEVTAPGLTTDNQFSFPDTPVGDATAPITFTVTNPVSTPLRVNGVDFLGGADMPDFVKSADTCQPTPAELAQGRGHLLDIGSACTFQLQFRPRHRDGIAECDGSAPNESCRRRATFYVTGEVDNNRVALTPNYVVTSGRAIGGVITAPGEICFSSAPPLGSCTPPQTLRIGNSGPGELTITSARLTRAGNTFEAAMLSPIPFPFARDVTIEIPVRFCNMAADPTDGEFTINSSSSALNPTTVVRLVNPLNRPCP